MEGAENGAEKGMFNDVQVQHVSDVLFTLSFDENWTESWPPAP